MTLVMAIAKLVSYRQKSKEGSHTILTLYHNPMTRSLRVLWLLEELGLDYVLIPVEFVPPVDGKIFAQRTPTGRFPTLKDEDITLCESGAIVQHLTERYGEGRLAPPIGSPLRAKYLQWIHFPEGTINPYLNAIQLFFQGICNRWQQR